MKEFFKKNWKLISIISAAAVAVIVTVVLCVCLIPRGKKQLGVPQNVQVIETTLTWDSVENADSGYTVKIGDDETTKVSGNSLDLTTVISKLVEGENKLSVRADETEAYLASEYSAEVNYEYTPAPPEKTPFAKPAAALDGDTLKWDAVTGATNGYTVKIGSETKTVNTNSLDLTTVIDTETAGEYKVSVKVNATDGHKESAYSDEVTYTYNPAAPEKTPFAKPAATLDGDTFKWNAVDGAASYTVKIGERELEPTTATELDLTTVIDTSVTAEYKVSVKVNATDDHKESAYSDEVTYNYVRVNPAFDAPANVAVEGDTLKWDAVTGAASYTVKIGGETVTVNTNSLDLTTVTAKLASGLNKLSVKANATEDYNESEYSATVDYTYTPSVDAEAADYKALVEAIGSITSASTPEQAAAVAAAITTADNKYNGLSDAAKALAEVTEAKASFDTKKAAYEEVYNPAKQNYDLFVAAISSAQEVVEAEEDVGELAEAVEAMNAANAAVMGAKLSELMVTAQDAAAYQAVGQALLDWNAAIAAAKQVWKNVTADTFKALEGTDAVKVANAEDNIETAEGLIAQYSDKKYVQNTFVDDEETTKISDKKAIADNALAAAKTVIDEIVADLKSKVEPLTGVIPADKVTKDYYDTLSGYKTVIDAFGGYANESWTDALTGKVTGEIAALLVLPDMTKTVSAQSAAMYNNKNAAKTYVYVMRKFYNVLGTALTGETEGFVLPALSSGTEGVEVTPAAANTDGEYVWTLAFTSPAVTAPATESETVTVNYTVKGEETETVDVTIGFTLNEEGNLADANVYGVTFNSDNGNFEFAKSSTFEAEDAAVYMDVYESKYVTYGKGQDNEGTIIGILGMPRATGIKVPYSGISRDSFISLLAKADIRTQEDLSLTFILYQKATVDGKAVCSSITSMAAVTETFDSITDDDVKERINFTEEQFGLDETGLGHGDGGFSKNFLDGLAMQFGSDKTSADLNDLLVYFIDASYTDGEGIQHTERFTFAPNIKLNENGSGGSKVDLTTIKEEFYKVFGVVENATFTMKAGLTLSESARENYDDSLRDSYTKTFTAEYSIGNVKLPVNGYNNDANMGLKNIIKLEDTTKITDEYAVIEYGSWELANDRGSEANHSIYKHDFHNGLDLLIFDVTDGAAIDIANPFTIYTHTEASNILWSAVNGKIEEVWRKIPAAERTNTKKFVFAFRVTANDTALQLGYIDSDLIFITNNDGNNTVITYTADFRLEAKGLDNTITVTSNTGNFGYGDWQLANDEGKEDVHKNYMHDYHDGLAMLIFEVPNTVTNPADYDFIANNVTPLWVYTHRDFSNIYWDKINAFIEEEWIKLPVAQISENKKFVFALQVIANEAALTEGYENSRYVYLTDSDGKNSVFSYEMDFTLPNDIQINRTNEPILFQGFAVANDIINGHISHMEIHFAKVDDISGTVNPAEFETAYVYYDENSENFVVYKNKDKTDPDGGLVFGKGANEYYTSLITVNTWFKNNYNSSFDIDGEGWYFRTKVIDKAGDNTYLFGDGISEWKTFYTPAA